MSEFTDGVHRHLLQHQGLVEPLIHLGSLIQLEGHIAYSMGAEEPTDLEFVTAGRFGPRKRIKRAEQACTVAVVGSYVLVATGAGVTPFSRDEATQVSDLVLVNRGEMTLHDPSLGEKSRSGTCPRAMRT